MDSTQLENLYFDIDFDESLEQIANRSHIEFDDFKQEVFLDITEAKKRCKPDCLRIAWKVAKRIQRRERIESHRSLDEMSSLGFDIAEERDRVDAWNHDGSRLSHDDSMVSDMVGVFQPQITRDIYKGKLILHGIGA